MIFEPHNTSDFNNPEIEQVQKHKHEYTYLGQYEIKSGLKLFSYNSYNGEINHVEIKKSNTVHAVPMDGVLMAIDKEAQRALVDTRKTYFQALNMSNAIKRVNKWKQGIIVDLFNLDKPSNNCIKFY